MTEFIAFDIGGTSIKYGIVNSDGQISEKGAFETPKPRADILAGMAKVVERFRQHHTVTGIGISAPGIVRRDGYMVTGGALRELYDFPLAKTLADQTGLPVKVENDANAAAIAERWLGNAQGIDNYICIVLGTGIGGGIVINGQVYRGAHGMAGEFGWNVTQEPDLTQDLEFSSLNKNAAVVDGLTRRYNASAKLVFPDDAKVTDARQILQLAEDKDPIAEPIVDDFYSHLAVMLINLFANFDPEVILIGGGISANDRFMENLQDKLSEYITRHQSLNFIREKALGTIKAAGLRNDAGLIGAVYPLVRVAK
ncbi:ROK family protein [Schleiferilactobacillus perolens]|jgi:predicted NBD/HSP70 family sugar kinase|uniref:ROK family protein n=1 Tax=Schleiferilactobacillus perolens TaxID=100468 RepID=UPI00235204F4|nr:ROK family protein [Schleiferilactobacillus perolens]MCI2171659.1 ROK family protein [Schleiferilactobacillus perolens]